MAPWVPDEAFKNIDQFSQLEIIYYFDQVKERDIVFSGRPRENPNYPVMGILAQRKKDRPNKIGLARVTLLELQDRRIIVKGLDALDGSPVIDIKPVFSEFQPEGAIIQPSWVADLMRNYWKNND